MDDPTPLSVILLWRDAREGLAGALRSLAAQVRSVGGEIVVATALRSFDAERASFPAWRSRFPRGRHDASRRAAGWPGGGRLAAGIGCVAVPGLLLASGAGDSLRHL